MSEVSLIWAQADRGVIGIGGALPWHLPEDLAHFKTLTAGHTVIMGRKTWESLPARARPLPGRRNIVISRQSEWEAAGAETAGSVPAALALAGDDSEVWIIGGQQIFDLALPYATRVELTEIKLSVADGDCFAPPLDGWTPNPEPWRVSATGLDYRFIRLTPATENGPA